MYDTSDFIDLLSLGTVDQYTVDRLRKSKERIGITELIVRVKGIEGIHTVDLYDLQFAADNKLCNIGKQSWFQGNTEWVLCKDVFVVDIQ